MQVKASELLARIREMYPEIEKNGIQTSCIYDEKTEAWLVERGALPGYSSGQEGC